MDLKSLEQAYTAAAPRTYRWYVGVYNDYLETHVVRIEQTDKNVILEVFNKLRFEHTISWNRNYLYEFKEEDTDKVKSLLTTTLLSTDRFDVFKACLYQMRSLDRSRVLDDHVIRKIPGLKAFIDDYVEPSVTPLQDKVLGMSRGEHSLRDVEALLISNRGFERIMDYRKSTYTGDRYHLTKLDSVELDLTADCNLKCHNCDRMCGRAASTELMTVEQVKKFVEDSKAAGKVWERIALTGGEPTMHPNIIEIVGLVLEYRNTCLPKSSYVQIVSNGYGESAEILKRIEATYSQVVEPVTASNTFVRNNNKRNKVVLHSPVNVAPVDGGMTGQDYRNGCWVTETTGLGLTRYGYYPCGVAAAIDRVFGFGLGIKSLKDVCMKRIVEQREKLCALCGRYNDLSICAEYYGPTWVVEEKTSSTWDRAFEEYGSKKPVLTLY